LSVFCPHLAEELWEKIGNKDFISKGSWPIVNENKIDKGLEKQEEEFEKTISDVMVILKILKEKEKKEAEKIHLYVLPNEIENYDSEKLSNKIGKEVLVYAVNDKNKYDPEKKSKKVKPGRPGIYVE